MASGQTEAVNAAPDRAALLDVVQVGALLGCSPRHVYRMVEHGKMPLPVRLGALVRWRRAELMEWLNAGCPPVRTARGAT